MSLKADWTHSILPLDDTGAQERWRALWERSPQRSAFSSVEYALAVSESFGIRCEVYLVNRPGNEDEAGAMVFQRWVGPYRTVLVPPFTPHTTFVFGTMPTDAEINQRRSSFEYLLQVLESRFDALRFQLHPSIADVRVCTWRRWTVQPYYTYQAAVDSRDEALSGWSRRARRTAKNEQDQFIIEEAGNCASEIASLHANGLARQHHRLPVDPATTTRLIENLHRRGLARLYSIRPAGSQTLTGGVALLVCGKEAYYWLGGSLPGSAMTVLLGGILFELCRYGVKAIDYVGANTPSIAEFKRQFGGEIVSYFGIEKVNRPELRVLKHLRSWKSRHL